MTRKQYTLGRKLAEEVLSDSANGDLKVRLDGEAANNRIGSMSSSWFQQPEKDQLPNLALFEQSDRQVDKRLLKYYKLTNYRRLKSWGIFDVNDNDIRSAEESNVV